MLKQIKRSVLTAAKAGGVFRLVRDSSWRQRRLLIIGYHGTSLHDEHEWEPALFMPPDVLERRLRILRQGGYAVLPLAEALHLLRENRLPPRSVVLTFDDGMADFAINVYPMLKRYGFPATVYLTTYYVTNNRPVFPLFCSYVMWKSTHTTLRSRDLVPGAVEELEWNLRSRADRQAAAQWLVGFGKRASLSSAELDEIAIRLATRLGVDHVALAKRRMLHLLNVDDVEHMARQGIDFQLHTHRHRTPLDRDPFLREIVDNRRSLRELTGQVGEHFCYPGGAYEPQLVPWLKSLGVSSATTCDTGIASSGTDAMLLPRLLDSNNLHAVEFESWTTGVGSFLPLRPHSP